MAALYGVADDGSRRARPVRRAVRRRARADGDAASEHVPDRAHRTRDGSAHLRHCRGRQRGPAAGEPERALPGLRYQTSRPRRRRARDGAQAARSPDPANHVARGPHRAVASGVVRPLGSRAAPQHGVHAGQPVGDSLLRREALASRHPVWTAYSDPLHGRGGARTRSAQPLPATCRRLGARRTHRTRCAGVARRIAFGVRGARQGVGDGTTERCATARHRRCRRHTGLDGAQPGLVAGWPVSGVRVMDRTGRACLSRSDQRSCGFGVVAPARAAHARTRLLRQACVHARGRYAHLDPRIVADHGAGP